METSGLPSPPASWVSLMVAMVALCPAALHAQAASAPIDLTASSANVSEPGVPVKIRILRWSTDEERTPFVAALTPAAPDSAAAGAAGDSNGPARGGRGTGRAARGGGGRAARGGAGRGGRGDAAADPMAAFTAAIGRAPTLGYLWTNDVTGYGIKYSYHASLPDGGERIILVTDRRLGAYSTAWKAASAPAVTNYEFTLIEIRLDARGVGGGKTSLTTKIGLDHEARTLALDDYAAAAAILQNVKR